MPARVFKSFNATTGAVCPICKTADNKETILAPIPGTQEGNISEAQQVHKECCLLVAQTLLGN